ncbi:MAG: hypothetical protein R3Y68_02160 [Rikenellaceae bacterium]
MDSDTIVQVAQQSGSGCPYFFLTSALNSAVFGELGRKNQSVLMDNNFEFQRHLDDLNREFKEEQLDTQIAFKRESYELGLRYQMIQSKQSNENRQKEVEFQYFCDNCWPLEKSILAFFEEQQASLNKAIVPLGVYIARTNVTTYNTNKNSRYNDLYETIKSIETSLGNCTIPKSSWKKNCQSTVAESMNINYILQGLPTLLIFPNLSSGKLNIEIATWCFNRGLGSMQISNMLSFPYALTDPDNDKVDFALQVVIGIIRDNYMVMTYHRPATLLKIIKPHNISKYPDIMTFIRQQYELLSMSVANSDSFRALCTPSELNSIESSLRINNNLLNK